MKKIKIKSIGWSGLPEQQCNYLKPLFDSEYYEFVVENEDITITNNFNLDKSFFKSKLNSKTIIFLGENIHHKHASYIGSEILRRLDLDNSFLSKLIPKKIIHPWLFDFNKKNIYWISTNDLIAKNVLNFPYFFDTNLKNTQELIDLKKNKLYTNKKRFCAFIVGNPHAKDRIDFFHKLSEYKKVDSFGPVLNNKQFPKELISKNRYKANQELFKDYKFVICFENSYANDYITEKLPNVMMANSIGIYRGAANINEFFNTKSFINFDDYGTYDVMIQKIIALDQDDEKYQKMLDEPFFTNNEIPPRIKNAKQDLRNFIEKVIND